MIGNVVSRFNFNILCLSLVGFYLIEPIMNHISLFLMRNTSFISDFRLILFITKSFILWSITSFFINQWSWSHLINFWFLFLLCHLINSLFLDLFMFLLVFEELIKGSIFLCWVFSIIFRYLIFAINLIVSDLMSLVIKLWCSSWFWRLISFWRHHSLSRPWSLMFAFIKTFLNFGV